MSSLSTSPKTQNCILRKGKIRNLQVGCSRLQYGGIGKGSMAGGGLRPSSGLASQTMLQRQPVSAHVFPFDQAWAPSVDAASLAPQLFAMSLFPYLCFLFFLTKSGKAPRLTLFGFYFLLIFVGATIPAGIYAKSHYGTSLANVDWLHGAAESLLTITNLLVVLGLRQGIREAEAAKTAKEASAAAAEGTTQQQQQGAGSSAAAPAETAGAPS